MHFTPANLASKLHRSLEPAQTAYQCANVRTGYRLLGLNTNSPCPMRAPGIVTGLAALEIAMDELAEALGMDPVELRLRNIPERNQKKDVPWTSNEIRACYETGAERFGWKDRDPRPGSMRDGHQRIGWGMASSSCATAIHADTATTPTTTSKLRVWSSKKTAKVEFGR